MLSSMWTEKLSSQAARLSLPSKEAGMGLSDIEGQVGV